MVRFIYICIRMEKSQPLLLNRKYFPFQTNLLLLTYMVFAFFFFIQSLSKC